MEENVFMVLYLQIKYKQFIEDNNQEDEKKHRQKEEDFRLLFLSIAYAFYLVFFLNFYIRLNVPILPNPSPGVSCIRNNLCFG